MAHDGPPVGNVWFDEFGRRWPVVYNIREDDPAHEMDRTAQQIVITAPPNDGDTFTVEGRTFKIVEVRPPLPTPPEPGA